MRISYTLPLSHGWARMKKALFQPFDMGRWLVIDLQRGSRGLPIAMAAKAAAMRDKGISHPEEFFNFPQTAWEWLQAHPVIFNLIILGIIFLFVLITALIWVSSRGKFMFLHNVALDKAEISIPWYEYRREANSLFIWRFFFTWIALWLFIWMGIHFFESSRELYFGDFPAMMVFWRIAGMFVRFMALVTVIGYIALFLNDFVVPIMYSQRVSASWGWFKFMQLFGKNFFAFVIYGIFIFALWVVVVIGVILFGVFTILMGFILLAIPFIGSVILLPVTYTFRALSLEFLAQFGEEYNVFPRRLE